MTGACGEASERGQRSSRQASYGCSSRVGTCPETKELTKLLSPWRHHPTRCCCGCSCRALLASESGIIPAGGRAAAAGASSSSGPKAGRRCFRRGGGQRGRGVRSPTNRPWARPSFLVDGTAPRGCTHPETRPVRTPIASALQRRRTAAAAAATAVVICGGAAATAAVLRPRLLRSSALRCGHPPGQAHFGASIG